MPGDFARGVVAAVFARGVHAGDVERLDPRSVRRLTLAREVEEVAVEIARDAPQQLLAVEAERLREPRDLIAGERRARFGFTQIESTGVLTASGSP